MTDDERHPKDIPIMQRGLELAEERRRTLRDNPPEQYKGALEAWGFRWMRRDAGWRHAETGSVMASEEATKLGDKMLRSMGWSPGEPQWMWVQSDLRLAFLDSDLGAMFPGKRGPYDLWHWVGHQVGQRIGAPSCGECGLRLGPPERCGACSSELRGGRCPKCSFVSVNKAAQAGLK